jgi:oligopeptide transport system ATP-binding protein
MLKSILKAKGLKKTYLTNNLFRKGEAVLALDDVDFHVERGEVVAVIGESGSGKTTLGKALCRLMTIDQGHIEFLGVNLREADKNTMRSLRRSFQMVFQNQSANLHPKMTVERMLDESLLLHRATLTPSERKAHLLELAQKVGLESRLNQRPSSLSGGEKRRAGLARILATKPVLIVADEPTSGLDAAIKLQIIELLKSLRSDDLSYVIISHDLGLVRRIADRVVVMLHGRVIEEFSNELLSKDGRHHPYTSRLMRASVLDRDRRRPPRERRDPPRHVRPSLKEARSGCIYITDCSLAERAGVFERCCSVRPELVQLSDSHRIACHGVLVATGEASVEEEYY